MHFYSKTLIFKLQQSVVAQAPKFKIFEFGNSADPDLLA